jgi:hypothetical protein
MTAPQESNLPEPKLLSLDGAARRLGIGTTKLREIIDAGEIPTVSIGIKRYADGTVTAARRLVPVEAVDAYADRLVREYGPITTAEGKPA